MGLWVGLLWFVGMVSVLVVFVFCWGESVEDIGREGGVCVWSVGREGF